MSENRHAKHAASENTSKKKNKKRKIRWSRVILAILLLLVVITLVTVAVVYISVSKNLPELTDESLGDYSISSYVLDKDGNYVDMLHAGENRDPVSYEEISPNMINALVAIEDQRFWSHYGLDPIRIAGAMIDNIKSGQIVAGGSTITQQLAGMVFLDREEKTYSRKLNEAIIAIKLEQNYSKEEIITHYLNRVYFGNSAYGVGAAAQFFFDKEPAELTVPESALLAGMIQNPAKWSPISHPENALARRNLVLSQMVETGAITEEECKQYQSEPIQLAEIKSINKSDDNFYANQSFIDHVINEAIDILDLEDNSMQLYTGGYIIHTTLDTNIQSYMESIYNDDSQFPKGDSESILQSAAVIMEPNTGAVRGIIGGRNQTGMRNLNRATQSSRQPGSSFKPIAVYGAAFENGYSPGSVIDDYPKDYGGHVFKNQNRRYKGLTTIREAIKASTNVVAVKTLEEIGIEKGFAFAESLGISTLVSPEDNPQVNDMNYSLALGGLTEGVSPLEMAGAYSAFANGGTYYEPYVITKITDSDGKVIYEHEDAGERVMSEETAYMMNSSLVSVVSESGGTGLKAALSGRQVAGKTGTTSDNKDYWFVGYTPQYACSVWMGFDTPREIKSVTSAGSSCAPIFQKIMAYAHEGLEVQQFNRPSGITSVTIDTKSGDLPSSLTPSEYQKTEIFNSKFAPTEISTVWEEVAIDPLSGGLYTENCPGEPEMKVYLKREHPWQDDIAAGYSAPEDASLEAPTEPCPLHADGASSGDFFLTAESRFTDGIISSAELYWQSLEGENVTYQVHRSDHAGFTPDASTLLTETTATVYTDGNPLKEGRNVYKIVAVDKENGTTVGISGEVSVLMKENTTHNGDDNNENENPPEEPDKPDTPDNPTTPVNSHLSLSGSSNGSSIQLNWNAPGNGNYQYFVFRDTSSNVNANNTNQIGNSQVITTPGYTDSAIESGTTYYYRVIAIDRNTNEQVATSDVIAVQN